MSATLAITSHCEKYCRCDKCAELIKNQFAAFQLCNYSKKHLNKIEPCPACSHPIAGQARGGFVIWSCWRCNMKLGSIMKVVTGSTPEKNYGFMEREDGTQVYFHLNRSVNVIFNWSDYPVISDIIEEPECSPQVGDVLIYQEFRGAKGPKALWWAYETQYTMVKKAIKDRFSYRLVRRDGRKQLSSLQPKPTYHCLWEGKDLNELRKVANYIECGEYDTMAVFFAYFDVKENDWFECDDPRKDNHDCIRTT